MEAGGGGNSSLIQGCVHLFVEDLAPLGARLAGCGWGDGGMGRAVRVGVEGGGAEGSTEGVSGEGASWVAVAGAVGVRVVVGVEV